ncbi:MAG: transposase [Verrucomicrobiae bacterium]|nr:transposase [Verrucomicrobiae bacterium]
MANLTPSEINDLEIAIPDSFIGFNPYEQVSIYERNLPHWRQRGATYFATFRTADSIPHEVHQDLKSAADDWRDIIAKARNQNSGILPENLKREFDHFQRRNRAKIESLLDGCAGDCLLRGKENLHLLAEAFHHFNGERYHLHAAVIMPNHCHVVIQPLSGHELSNILGSWKSFSARNIRGRRHPTAPFWQAENFDRIIRDECHYRNAVRCLLKNPAKARLAAEQCWLFACGVNHPMIHN